jgi:hypothetical protein
MFPMRTKINIKIVSTILIAFSAAMVMGCEPIEEDTASTTPTTRAASIVLNSDVYSIQTNNSDIASITATVLDSQGAVVSEEQVNFSVTNQGMLNVPNSITDDYGRAEVELRSGTQNQANRSVTVTAAVPGGPSQTLDIQITGTTITFDNSSGGTSMEVGESITNTISVADADGGGIRSAAVTLTLDTASTGSANIALASATTNESGKVDFTLTGTVSGTVVIRAEALNAFSSSTYDVGATGNVFKITSPTSPATLATDTPLTIQVNAPGVSNVVFTASGGIFTESGTTDVTRPVSGSTATATFRASSAGYAKVSANPENDISTTSSVEIAVSAPVADATKLSLQAVPSVVPRTVGDSENNSLISATVTNDLDEPVGGAWVSFTIENPTGGGESLTETVSQTDVSGIATTTFTSGSISSDSNGVTIRGRVINAPAEPQDTVVIIIGGTAGSVVVNKSTTVESVSGDASYKLAWSVTVADANGTRVSGAKVSLGIWPNRYWTGYWLKVGDEWFSIDTGGGINEDINRNLVMDTGEDDVTTRVCYDGDDSDSDANEPFITVGGDGDGQLTPQNSFAGTIPDSVTTDSDGQATFYQIYPKDVAHFLEVEISASTTVSGTETKSLKYQILPVMKGDEEAISYSAFGGFMPSALACP